MGEYLKNKEKLRILREKTAARRAAAKAKKLAKKKGVASRSRRKTKKGNEEKESDEEEELEKSEEDIDEEEEEEEEPSSRKMKKDSLTGTEESDDELEDPETAAKIALNLLSDAAAGSTDRSTKGSGKSKDGSDDEGVVAITSEKDKEEKKPASSLKVIVRRTFKK